MCHPYLMLDLAQERERNLARMLGDPRRRARQEARRQRALIGRDRRRRLGRRLVAALHTARVRPPQAVSDR